MDYNQIGNFIKNERKNKKMTQAKLAEKLFVSEKTVSKWESGKGVPDTNILPKLCEMFGISINELLNGERISKENYENKAEEKLLELQNHKEISDKNLLFMEIVIAFLASAILLALHLISICIQMQTWQRILIICCGWVLFLIGMFSALRIEQVAGYYVCKKCNKKFIPKYSQVFWAMHVNRTRYMKCPHCQKKSWCKKTVK